MRQLFSTKIGLCIVQPFEKPPLNSKKNYIRSKNLYSLELITDSITLKFLHVMVLYRMHSLKLDYREHNNLPFKLGDSTIRFTIMQSQRANLTSHKT